MAFSPSRAATWRMKKAMDLLSNWKTFLVPHQSQSIAALSSMLISTVMCSTKIKLLRQLLVEIFVINRETPSLQDGSAKWNIGLNVLKYLPVALLETLSKSVRRPLLMATMSLPGTKDSTLKILQNTPMELKQIDGDGLAY